MKSISSRIVQVFRPFATDKLLKKVLWKKYLEHLNHLQMMSEKRKMEKKNKNLKENTMSYEEFDWMEMLNSGTLAKQRACVLENTSINIICLQWKVKTSHRKLMLLWITYGHLPRARKKKTKLPQCGRDGWSWWMWSRWRGWGITHLS